MKAFVVNIILIFVCFYSGNAQKITLEQCLKRAKENTPLLRGYDIVKTTTENNLYKLTYQNILPQLKISGKISYQSEVIEAPVDLSEINYEIPVVNKHQYNATVEAYYSLTNLLFLDKQKKIVISNSIIANQNLNLQFTQLKKQVQKIFFGIVLLHEKIKQTKLIIANVKTVISKSKAMVNNHVLPISELEDLITERLSIQEKLVELKSYKIKLITALRLLTKLKITENSEFEIPKTPFFEENLKRIELKFFREKHSVLQLKKHLLKIKIIPQISFFGVGGVGNPGLNILSNEPSEFYVGGISLHWNIFNFYTYKKEGLNIKNKIDELSLHKEQFLQKIKIQEKQKRVEIKKYDSLIKYDKEIIVRRIDASKVAKRQLALGVISVNNYILKIRNEDKARQQLALHKTQQLEAIYELKNILNNN